MLKMMQLTILFCGFIVFAHSARQETKPSNVQTLYEIKDLIRPDGYAVADEEAVLASLNLAITIQEFNVNTVIPRPHRLLSCCLPCVPWNASTAESVLGIYNHTLLHFAVQAGMQQVVGALLKAGANPRVKSYPENKTPLHLLIERVCENEGPCTNAFLSIGEMLINYGSPTTTSMIKELTEKLKFSMGNVDTANLEELLSEIVQSRQC